METFDVSKLPEDQRNNIEADSYWCMTKFLDSIQVNYIFAQTGIQEKVKKLKELIERIDGRAWDLFIFLDLINPYLPWINELIW